MNIPKTPFNRIPSIASAMFALACLPPQLLSEDKAPEPEVLVQTALIDHVTLRAYVTVYGTVEPEPATEGRPAAQFTLTAPYAGLVSELAAVEGAHVEKGTRLLRLDARLADGAITKARTHLEFAQKTHDRQKKLAEVDGTSTKLLDEAARLVAEAQQELREAEAQRSLLDIASPVAGTVTYVYAQSGQPVEAGQRLVGLLDADRLVLRAALPTRELASLKLGLKAEVTPSFGGKPVNARLTYFSPEADAQTDTVPLRLTLMPGCGLRPGQFATARIVREEHEGCLTVPMESVFTDRDSTSSISIAKEGRSKKISVTPGLRDGDRIEVKGEGLAAGMQVITTGSYALPDGTKILAREASTKGGGDR